MNFIRFFSHSTALQNANKSALATLRKKTGYSLSNCRKALELYENDAAKAEEWLKEQAKALGWAKVQKLDGRAASQGLIGVSAKDKKAVLVEVNCETDFVARNAQFKSLVEKVVKACYQHPVKKDGSYSKKLISGVELSKLATPEGHVLENEVALLVGNIGENILLKRATLYEVFDKNLNVAVDVHPPTDGSNNILLGKYGSLVVYETQPDSSINKNQSSLQIGVSLCKHVIGMNPKIIGKYDKSAVAEAEEVEERKTEGDETEEIATKQEKDDGGVFVNQEFLLDSNITVGQFLEDCRTKILDFDRFECGEVTEQQEAKEDEVRESSKVAQ